MLSLIESRPDLWLGWSYWAGGPWWKNGSSFAIADDIPVEQPRPGAVPDHVHGIDVVVADGAACVAAHTQKKNDAGIGHPHYDLATLAMFLRLDDAVAFELGARHDGAPLDDRQRASFRALRQLVALLCGLTFLSLSEDLGARSAPTVQDAPSLGECYTAMRAGQLDLSGAHGRTSFGLALLAEGSSRAAR